MSAPFKVLYSNDLTHIETCVSPYHRQGEKFNRDMLDASVDETADTGIDAHLLQPGFGWMALWQSQVLPPARHWDWLRNTYDIREADHYLAYVLNGGDIVRDFTRRCREKNLAPFISYRMNDTHHLEKLHSKHADGAQLNVSEFYQQHPEYILEPASNSWQDRGQNWAIPEVREYKFSFIRELCENYDLDGLELDFVRYPRLFRLHETPPEQREAILTEFVTRVRTLLDATARGTKRWLSLRLPLPADMHGKLGINFDRLDAAGVDMFNLSSYYYTVQNTDISLIRQATKNTSLYLEMTNCISVGAAVDQEDGDNFELLNATENQLRTTAQGAYARGIDGISLFNFVYYRKHGSEKKQTAVSEPPFGAIKRLREREVAPNSVRHYFIGSHWQDDGSLPKSMSLYGQYAALTMNVAPSGADHAALFAHVDHAAAGDWEAWVNDRPVFRHDAVPCEWRTPRHAAKVLGWPIPVAILNNGANEIVFRSKDAVKSVLDFVELIVW
ncbi:MAG: hypothetical protein LBK76_01665 [Verrucomicrobiales bacterium]|jgi:hypothetical protein|nr:hypothetical protein [Verrucomicrobiales bacterium]